MRPWQQSAWVLLPLCVASSVAQAAIRESFTGATVADWAITMDSALTAADPSSGDAPGAGWLRLNPNVPLSFYPLGYHPYGYPEPGIASERLTQGSALYQGQLAITPAQPLFIEFEYVSWGGSGADGISAFLFDASVGMSGAYWGGSLGYCGGQGAYLGIGLDEYGMFSDPINRGPQCGNGMLDPDGTPAPSFTWDDFKAAQDHVVLRGFTDSSAGGYNALLARAPYSPQIDVRDPAMISPYVDNYPDYPPPCNVPGVNGIAPCVPTPGTVRPAPTKVKVEMTPASPSGYTINVTLTRNGVAQTLIANQLYSQPAPANLGFGFGSGSGWETNAHEVRNLVVAILAKVSVAKAFATPTAEAGNSTSYTVTFTNNSGFALTSGNVSFADTVPAELQNATWTCAGTACPAASGSGDISALNGADFADGDTVAFTVTGTLASTVTDGQIISSTATASFNATSLYGGDTQQASASLQAVVTPPTVTPPTPVVQPVPSLGAAGLALLSGLLASLGALRRRKSV